MNSNITASSPQVLSGHQALKNRQAMTETSSAHSAHTDTHNSIRSRQFDFSNMTLEEQSNAAEALYQQGVLSIGEVAFLTGRYNLIEHDGELGGTTLAQAKAEKFDVIGQLKENLSTVKSQGAATQDVVRNYETMINKLEVYQFGFHASA
ncbi:hypothetical protein [Pseudoalteromonas luteoviolacea]|uniref:Uncharacterized protein n=1 Tax=Pseudoalteromonas luteoviolacea H33 TaxID=1365251 RepID=A0A167AG23_9GAMM|nr:hypothetical protein [Pseudoalteromonas luteoviolacea]KZN45351.1 hypothetical protein N476_04875 [Pseudoalteromonas luteoviolacea H33]KZN70785.1 hypothetical protein N477_05165 [Pseudoalteromonas luteoviolacea H33-S]